MVDVDVVRQARIEHRAVMGAPQVVHLHPADVAGLTDAERRAIGEGATVRIVADPGVEVGHYSIGGR